MAATRATLVVGAKSSGLSAARLLRRLAEPLSDRRQRISRADPEGVEPVPRPMPRSASATFSRSSSARGFRPTSSFAPLYRGGSRSLGLALAADHVHGRVIAVTGTNRHGDDARCRHLVPGAGVRSNLDAACDAVGGDYDDLVVEVSSFQLEWPHTLRRDRDRSQRQPGSPGPSRHHGGLHRRQMNLFANMDADCAAVFLRDETWWQPYRAKLRARISTFGTAPLPRGEQGVVFATRPKGVRLFTPERVDLALRGEWPRFPHEIENVASAAEIARLAGVPVAAVERAVADFTPLPHRLSLIGTRGGVRYFDDSKATNIGATLKSLEAFDEPVILLAGGVGKGVISPCSVRRPASCGWCRVRRVRSRGRAALAGRRRWRVRVCRRVRAGGRAGEAGDVVLLAPACASFDEFRGYADRGRRFIELLAALGT
jgi:UDP-N-acetylmuramoylalanine--D-glutamate ligase